MKSIYRTEDVAEIRGILAIDGMYESTSYDGSPELCAFIPEGVWMVLMQDDNQAGMINLLPLNNVTWMPHIFILKEYRGKGSEEWGTLVAQYMCLYFGAKKFLALSPYYSARKYAERMGMCCTGILRKSILKGGELMDQYILEMGEAK